MIGTVTGVMIGVIICVLLKKYQFIKLPPDVYYIDRLPVMLSFNDIILVTAVSIIITLLSTIYPATRVSKFNPVEIIRYG
jgi:lipoprotein-releasing system permease protein